MNLRLFLVFFCCVFFVAPSFQYGILKVEEIWSTEDVLEVKVEEMIIQQSGIFVDYIESLSGEGVTIEDVIFKTGSITIPQSFTTTAGIEFKSSLNANNGIFADAGAGSGAFSFSVENNSGNTYILGALRAQGGLNIADRFFVDGVTGNTRIEVGTLRPNGGVSVSGGAFSVNSVTGGITSKGNVQIAKDLFFGELAKSSDRVISRSAATGANGGGTYYSGQDSAATGGDLVLQPGKGTTPGNIFFGTSRNSDLYFGRTALSNGDNGGQTTFAGQSSTSGNGGSIFFNAGHSLSTASGGDIVLAPGLSSLDGRAGRFIVGSPTAGLAGHDVTIGRPPLDTGIGGKTIFKGQSTDAGIGGSFYLQGGSVLGGTGRPGDLYLTPGVASTGDFSVVLGRDIDATLRIRRVPTVTSGGLTSFSGQDGNSGAGGDLSIRGGSSTTGVAGGNLLLIPGSSDTGKSGNIVLGLPSDSLVLSRKDATGAGGLTNIVGQNSLEGSGGDIFFLGGDGEIVGGDLEVFGGAGLGGLGGDVLLRSGDSGILGGSVLIRAGNGATVDGGDISLATNVGNIVFSARGQATDGKIVVTPSAGRFYSDEVPVIVNNANIVITAGSDTVTISNNPEAIISWNGTPVLKQSQTIAAPLSVLPTLVNIRTDVSNLSADFDALLQALNQCGHGLVSSVTQPNNVVQTC